MAVTITTRSVTMKKVNIIREVIDRTSSVARRDLTSTFTKVVVGTSSVDAVLDFIAAERLRCMPQAGSKYDKVLRWAEIFVLHVAAFSNTVSEIIASSAEASQQIWGSSLLLLQLGEGHVELLEKLFGLYYRLGLGLDTFTAHAEYIHEASDAQSACAQAYATLLQTVANSTIFYHKKATNTVVKLKSGDFERYFGRSIETFYTARAKASSAMWTLSIESMKVEDRAYETQVVRRFLAPQDSVVQALISGRISSRHQRAEYTCEWATKSLNDFARSKNGLLVVTGKQYSGKSVLAGWIAERISNTGGRLAHDVISYDLDPALKEHIDPLSVVKGLALQAFDRLVGDQVFYRALCSVVRADTEGRRPAELTEILWTALHSAFDKLDKTMLIIDGSEILGEQEQFYLLQRLASLSAKHSNVKVVMLSRPLNKPLPKNTKLWTIENEDVVSDISSFALERLSEYSSLDALPQSKLHGFSERIASSSNGSFAWADVAIEIVSQEKVLSNISKTLDGLPKNLQEMIDRLIATISLQERDTRSILAHMLASQRPLLLGEIKNLLQIDCSALQISERFTDTEEEVRRACGGLVRIADGVVRFRSLAVRDRLLNLAASVKDFSNSPKSAFPFHIAEASYDICVRSLAYIKLVLDRTYPIAVEFLTQEQLTEAFSEHSFLEYAVRYWANHFRQSPMHQYPNEHKLTGTFRNALPDAVSLARIEGSCLRAQYDLHESCDLLLLCVKLRKMVFGDESHSVLQATINLALTRQRLLNQDYNIYYYEAFRLARKLLSEDSDTTILCARRYIDSLKIMTKSTQVDETLTWIVTMQRKQYGVSHSSTITYMRRLAQYYTIIKENSKAATLNREIYEVVSSKYGYHAKETEEIYKELTQVATKEELTQWQLSKYQQESAEKTLEVSDVRRVTSTKDVVEQYETEKNVEKAEEVMVNYWREISEKSRTSRDVKIQEQQVDVTMEYVKFLQRQNRKEEATTILNGLYHELEKNSNYSDKKISWIQRIGSELKTMGSASTARGVYSYLWKYYRSTGQQTTTEAKSIAKELSETATTSVSSAESIEERAEVYKEILETSSLTSQTVDETTIKAAQQLISLYSSQERYEEIIEVTRDVLQRAWSSVLQGQKDTKMVTVFSSELVYFAKQLSTSYMRLSYVDEASTVMYGLFAAYRHQARTDTETFISYSKTLISHYQTVYRHSDALNVYQSTWETLASIYGGSDKRTVNIGYEKADYELKQNRRKQALKSYESVWTSLRDSKTDVVSKEAIRAGQAMCTIYEKEQNWEAARSVYATLWKTYLQRGQEYNLGVEFVNSVFDKFLWILESKLTVDYQTRRQLATEYRHTCIKFYGQDSEQTISSTLKLAQLSEKDERYQSDAIAMYENILSSKKISSASMLTIAATARQQLAHLYSKLSITTERAQNLYIEEYEVTRGKHGIASSETLAWLGLLVSCYIIKKDTASAQKWIEAATTEILLQETDTSKLYESSKLIASILKSQDSKVTEEFVAELRHHAIHGESSISSLKGKSIHRRSYTFIVGVEEVTRGTQFSVIMSELMTETILVSSFKREKASNASFDVLLLTGNRLRIFLKSKGRTTAYQRIETELYEIFIQKVVVSNAEVEKSASRQFFDIVLNEIEKDSHDLSVLQIILEAITRSLKENQFQRAYSLAYITDRYMHLFDGFRSQSKIELAFQICLRLSSRGGRKAGDAAIEQKFTQLSGTLLTEVIQAARAIQLSMVSLPLADINILVGILGETKNYTDLEWILLDLWNARHSQSQWPATTVVLIGRRLVECRFSMGERSSALGLLEDICYNLRRVWGSLDKTTLEMEALRAQMYTSLGQHTRAMGVHEDILAHMTSDELDMDQVTGKEEGEIAVKHLQQLRLSFLRNGAKWPKDKDESVYDDLYHIVSEQVADQDAWKSAKIEDVNKWKAAFKTFKDDGNDAWRGVYHGNWEFIADDTKYKHINAMKRRSTRVSSIGYSNGHSNGTNGVNGSSSSRLETITIQGKTSNGVKSQTTTTSGSSSQQVKA